MIKYCPTGKRADLRDFILLRGQYMVASECQGHEKIIGESWIPPSWRRAMETDESGELRAELMGGQWGVAGLREESWSAECSRSEYQENRERRERIHFHFRFLARRPEPAPPAQAPSPSWTRLQGSRERCGCRRAVDVCVCLPCAPSVMLLDYCWDDGRSCALLWRMLRETPVPAVRRTASEHQIMPY